MASVEAESPKIPIRIGAPVGELGGRDGNHVADVVAVEMHLNIFIASGAVSGAKILFTIGAMTEEFKDTIRKFQRQIVGLSNPDGRVDPNGITLKFLNGPISARGGKFKPGPEPPPADVAAARKKIVETSRSLLLEGGHFLMGAMGDMPGRANGHPNRLSYTRPITFMDRDHQTKLGPSVNAAWCVTGKFGTLGCMGRPDHLPVLDHTVPAHTARGAMIESYGDAIGRMQKAEIPFQRWPGLDHYEKKRTAFDAARSFEDFNALLTGKTLGTQFPRRISPGGPFHVGEGCMNRRHYDCIGFVNYVLSRVLAVRFQRSMQYFREPDSAKPFAITVFKDKREVFDLAEPGDLVFKEAGEDHCGIVSSVRGTTVVTNCREMSSGVIHSALTDEWHSLARLRRV